MKTGKTITAVGKGTVYIIENKKNDLTTTRSCGLQSTT